MSFPDPVEDHDRVVDRQPDDRQHGGEEDAVDRLAPPGEDADHGEDHVRHRQHGCSGIRPSESEGEVDHLRADRDEEREDRLVTQLLAEARADQFVALLLDRAADLA